MRTRTPAQLLPLLGMQTLQIKITAHPNGCTHGYKARVVLPHMPKTGMYLLDRVFFFFFFFGQGMGFGLSVLN